MLRHLTLVLCIAFVNASASYQDRMNDREDTFAANPLSLMVHDSRIVQNSSLVHLDTSVVNYSSAWDLIRMKVFKARLSDNIFWLKSQYVNNRLGREENIRFGGQIWKGFGQELCSYSREGRTVYSHESGLHLEETGVCISKKMLSPTRRQKVEARASIARAVSFVIL